jgi:hypothetical protein
VVELGRFLRLAAASGLWLLVLACSDGRQCTEAGCFDGFRLEFAPGFRAPGDFTFVLESPSGVISCAASIGSTLEQAPGGDCVLEGDERGIVQLTASNKHPVDVELVVSRDDEEIMRVPLELNYETNRPNGPNCPPSCREAAARVDVP